MPSTALESAALEQALNMASASRMTHTTGIGRSFAARMRARGLLPAAENIASGQESADRALAAWRSSPPHRRNMLDPRFRHFGMASATDAGGSRYWAMVLAE